MLFSGFKSVISLYCWGGVCFGQNQIMFFIYYKIEILVYVSDVIIGTVLEYCI